MWTHHAQVYSGTFVACSTHVCLFIIDYWIWTKTPTKQALRCFQGGTHQRHLTVLHSAVYSEEGVIVTLQRAEKVEQGEWTQKIKINTPYKIIITQYVSMNTAGYSFEAAATCNHWPPSWLRPTSGECVDQISLSPAGYCSQQESVCTYLPSGVCASRVQSPEGVLSGEAINFVPGKKK